MGMNENEGGNENCKLVHTMGGAGSMAGSILHVIFLAMRAFMVWYRQQSAGWQRLDGVFLEIRFCRVYRFLQVFRHLLPWPVDPVVSSMSRIAVEAVIEAPPHRTNSCFA